MMKKFAYKNKFYFFYSDLFSTHSDYFSNSENYDAKTYSLVSEYDYPFDLSDESINIFIQFCQNQYIEITNETVMPVNFLSQKYNVILLLNKTDEYIKVHYKELIDKFLSNNLQKIQQKSNITQYEDIISKYLHEVISDDRLLQLNVSNIYRIFVKYYLQKKNDEEDKSIQHKIIIFLFKYCQIHGKDSSILFSLIEIGEEEFEFLSFMLCKYHDFIDFNYIDKRFYQSINLLFQQQRNQKEELLDLKQMIEDQRSLFQSQITNIYSNLGKIEIQKSIKTITKNQFHNFSFKEVEIPPTVKTIESNAFNGCSSLVQIIIPKRVEIIDSYAFANCSSLTTITIQTVIIDSINKGTFLNCSSLTQISIPDSVCKICHSSFKGCSSLTQILIPSSVKSIESYAFSECSSLMQISIPSSIEFIGSFAFNKCKSLNQITIPSINSIENGTFYGCTSLEKIIIPSTVTKICGEAFRGCSSLMKVKIPSSVISIGSYAFVDCKSLIKITIPLITVIEKGLFYRCSSLVHLSIPSSVTEICNDSFNGCSSLKYLEIPSSVKFIGSDAFKGCSLLDESIKTNINQLMNKNKRKINELKYCLINTQIPEKYNQMKEKLIKHLNDDNYAFDEDDCLYLEAIINQFLTNANLTTNSNTISTIDWPINNDVLEYNKTENIKLFEILIWYSQIYTILNDLSDEKDIILNLFKLIDFDEMIDACEILFSNIIKNDKKDVNHAFCTLNSHAICKLLELNESFISDPHRISKVINHYIDRKKCDTNEISWIYHISKLLPSDLILKIPQFKPTDLIFLVVNEKLNASTQKGPLIEDIEIEESNNFLDKVLLLAMNEFTSFSDAAVSISRAVCDIQLQNYEEIRSYLYNEEISTEENYRIIEKMRCLFVISDSLEKINNQQLIFDDLSLLSKDWLNSTELLNRFPSMFFWFCKNGKCADQIISKSLKYSIKKDQIPFWLITLRILSSRNCIAFENKINNDLSKIINEITTNLVIQYLDDSNNSNNSINYNWLNILITNLPHQIINFDIKIIHDFLIILSKDKQNYPSNEINDIFNTIFQEVISKIIQSILSNKNHRITMNDSLNQFLLYPSRYILSKTNETINEIKQSLLTNKSTIDLMQFLNSLDILKDMIQNINKSIIEEEERMKIIYMEMLKRNKEKEIHWIRTDINKYNEFVLSFSNIPRREFNCMVEKFKKYIEYYPKFIFKNEGIKFPFLTYSSCKNVKITIKKNDKNIFIMLPATGKYVRNYYFYPDEEFIEEKNKNANLNIISVGSIFFGYFNEDADLNEIISGNVGKQITYPILLFGKYIEYQKFNNIINELYDKLISFNEILKKKDMIILENHLEVKKILYLIKNNNDNLKVKWSDNRNAEIVQIQLNKLRDYLINIENLINNFMKNITIIQNKISSILTNSKTYVDNHDIQIIRPNHLHTPIFKFSQMITTINPIIQPILLISPENKIICTMKKVKCNIGPVFHFHKKSNILINIISFIKEKISCNIIYENLEFEKVLLIDEGFDLDEVIFNIENPYENQVIQLNIDTTKIKLNEPKIVELKGKLNIQTRIYEPFLLPFEITIELIPLKILLHCFEYKLAEENESLRLCCDKIKSGEKINFEIENLCTNDNISFLVELESNDGNEVNKPELFIDNVKKCLTLTFPYVFAKSRCRFKILISLSQNFIVTINCDFYIFPLNISLNDNEKLIILLDESKWHEKFILSENEPPKPLDIINSHHYLINKSNSTNFDKFDLLNLSISDLPSIDFPCDLSISSLRTFYFNCTLGASILPISLFYRQINKDDQEDIKCYFTKLLKIFNEIIQNNKKSILSKYINMFIDSFTNCIVRLQQSGIKFTKLEIPKIYHNVNKHEFIILPKIEMPKLKRIKWVNECQGDEDKINIAFESILLNNDLSAIDDNDIEDDPEKMNHFIVQNGLLIPIKMHKEMFASDLLKGHKILIVMLYDCRINLAENPRVSSRNLFDYGCLADAIQHFGIEIFVVHNYKDAINELTKQTKPGYCDYYATWVISGLPYDIPLPDGGNQYLVNQFIDCLIQFWRNGGSVVMFSDGDPFTFQTNLFLEKIEFFNGQKTQLRVNGNHKGKHYIVFDKNRNKPVFERVPLSLNIDKIYEGESISFVKNDKSFYSPFVPLIKDSEDGITILFYAGDQNKNFMTGDIIIDCGFSKLFADIHCIKSNHQYFQNIAGWTFQIKTAFMNGFEPKDFLPKAVNFLLNESEKCNLDIPPKLMEIKDEKDVNLIDSIQKINSIGEFIDIFESLLNLTMSKMEKLKSDDILKSEFEKLKCRLNNEDDDNDEIHQKISILIGFASGEIKSIFDNDTIVVMRK